MDKREELVELYFTTINKTAAGNQWKKRISREIERLLNDGASPSIIEKAILTVRTEGFIAYTRAHLGEENNSILEAETFYYHPALQISPPPPVITINDDGTFSKKQETFYLKMKECFTFEDMLEYFYLRFPRIDRNEKRDLGAIEYLFNRVMVPVIKATSDKELNPIDLMLFTIDSAAITSSDEDNKLAKLLELADYVENGLLVYQDKKEGCILAGINHVI